MRHGYAFVLLGAVLFSCGSDGGPSYTAGTEEKVLYLNLGNVRGDMPTTVELMIAKPFHPQATVELLEVPTGAFQPGAGLFPISAPAGPEASFWLTFTPPAAPAAAWQEGTIRLLFRRLGGGEAVPMTLHIRADIETPTAQLLQAQAFAGKAAVGETVHFSVMIENTSDVTPITVTDVVPPTGEFSLDPDALPVPALVGPDSRFIVKLLYTPQGEWTASSVVRIHHSVAAEPFETTVLGIGIAPLVVTEGWVQLDPVTFESDWLTLDVPAEGVSIVLEAWGDPDWSLIDVVDLEGPNSKTYVTSTFGGPLGWTTSYPAGARGYLNVELPNSDLPEVQLVRGGGQYSCRLRDAAFASDRLFVRATVSQRAAGMVREGTLDLRVFLADSFPMADRLDPMSDVKLASIMETIDTVFAQHRIRLGAVTFAFMEPAYDTLADDAATQDMLVSLTAGLEEGPLNLFFVGDMVHGGVGIAGVAGAVPGPRANGTPYSGVVIDFNHASAITVGAVAAHEMGHYLGHAHVGMDDEVLLLPHEAYAVLRHPLLRPGLPQDVLSPPESTNFPVILAFIDTMAPMDLWCGTCTRPPLR